MDSLDDPASRPAQHPPHEGSTLQARNFFDADIREDSEVPQLAANAAARAAAPARRPRPVKATPNIRDPTAARRNSAATQGRTKVVAPAGSFCVLTQELHECATIQAAHVAPRKWHKSSPERVRNIEYHFGFPRAGRLNLDTRWNIFFLVAHFHILYDHDGFILIPTLAILQLALKFMLLNKKLAAANKPLKFFLDFFKMPPLGWTYEVLPVGVSPMQCIPRKTLRRVKQADGTFTMENSPDYRKYAYPYHTLPYIRSHVNPCFIILNAWNTLNKATELPDVWTDDQKQAIQLIHHIAAFWLSPAPGGFQLDRDIQRLAADPEEVEDDHAYRESTPNLPLDPVLTSNLPAVRAPDSDAYSPPIHSSPMGDHANRRALKAPAVHDPRIDSSEAGTSQKRRGVDDIADADTPLAGPSKRPRTQSIES